MAADLSVSFEEARANGNYNNGPVVSFSAKEDANGIINVPVSKTSANSYFVAVSLSTVRDNDTFGKPVLSEAMH